MLDNDNLTYSYQRRSVSASSERALITLERSQKLDLLLHLLANLQQSLIVCGPEGIGKTTLLEAARQSRKDIWEMVVLPATANSSFESLIGDLLRCLNIGNASIFDLSALREFCARHKVVLMIDDAGNLVPGLITTLMEFADSLAGLRLVLAMSHDQFHMKSGTDRLVEECHFIELPPLNKKQCREYLQNLSAQPGALVSLQAVDDALVEKLYRETHGIPGKLLAELPKLAEIQNRTSGKLGLWVALAAILAVSGFAAKSFLPTDLFDQSRRELAEAENSESQNGAPSLAAVTPPAFDAAVPPVPVSERPNAASAEPIAAPTVTPLVSSEMPQASSPDAASQDTIPPGAAESPAPAEAEAVEPLPAVVPVTPQVDQRPALPAAQPATSAPVIVEEAAKPVASIPVVEKPEPAQAAAATATRPEPAAVKAEEPAVVSPASVVPAPKPAERKPAKSSSESGDHEWIMAQPANNFTLQVMVLSNKASAIRFLKKYVEYGDALKFYPINKGDQEKYVLIYGSFASAAEAQQFKAAMPGEFKQALEKRFRAVQKESRQ